MKKLFYRLFLSALLCGALVPRAEATGIYRNDFQCGSPGSEWTVSGENTLRTDTAPNRDLSSWGRFLGQFRNDSVKLSLSGVAKGRVTLSFDTYFIRSWDGNDSTYGRDFFKVGLGNGTTLLNDTFSNGNPAGQTYHGNGNRPSAYGAGSNNSMMGSSQQWSLGYFFNDHIRETNEGMDSLYRFQFSFMNESDSLDIIFAASGLQTDMVEGIDGEFYMDESWGLDNVVVDVAPVPEPSTSLLLCSGVLFLLALRHKRARALSNS